MARSQRGAGVRGGASFFSTTQPPRQSRIPISGGGATSSVIRIRSRHLITAVMTLLVILSYAHLFATVTAGRGMGVAKASTREKDLRDDGKRKAPLDDSEGPPGGRGVGEKSGKENSSVEAGTDAKATIAYAISITACGDDGGATTLQGAAVLRHSIRLVSVENPASGSRYAYEMIAFVHPSAAECSASDLRSLGYDVQIRETPINATQIQGDFLRRTIQVRGCCQEKELLKLYSYTLTEYPVVVHLDVDSLLLRPLDDLFDVMIDGRDADAADRLSVHGGASLPEGDDVDFFFTRDYNLVNKPGKLAGIQGGFMVVRPSVETYEEYRAIVLKGDHRPGSGWDGMGHGGYYGAQQIQGLCAYYYDHVHPGTAVELDRCRYNQMADDPRFGSDAGATAGEDEGGTLPCRDGRDICEDCRLTPLNEIKSAHFTICQKPWTCRYFGGTDKYARLCNELHGEWHRIRSDLEVQMQEGRDGYRSELATGTDSNGITIGNGQMGDYRPDHFRGHCSGAGKRGYIPLKIPSTA